MSKTTILASPPVLSVGASRVAYTILFLYFAIKPFYFFDVGLPQIGDIIGLAFFVVVLLSKGSMRKEDAGLYTALLVFCAYTVLISIVFYLYFGDFRTLKSGIFYVFNALILYGILKIGANSEQFFKMLMIFIVVGVLIQVVASFIADPRYESLDALIVTDFYRQTLFFKNANQLCYWSLLSATIYFICANQVGVRIVIQLCVSIIFWYILSLGLSKAAIIAMFVLTVIHFSRRIGHIILFVFFAGAVFAAAHGTVGKVTDRLANIGEQEDDSILGRGYDRIWAYPQYLLFGAGEWGLGRFPRSETREIHSTIGVIVFSYGFVGTTIFGVFIWLLYRRVGFAQLLYLLPAFVYGGVHQGLRFSFLWVLFGLLAVAGEAKRRDSEADELAER